MVYLPTGSSDLILILGCMTSSPLVLKIFHFVFRYGELIQYVVLGPRVKVIYLNILPESSCNELKYSLKVAFMFLSIILKFQVPDINVLLGIRKKATVFDGPWPANLVLCPRLR